MSSISLSIDECIKELEFVASIPPNHKPYYKSKTTIERGAWFATINRRWNHEKGEYGIIHIKEVLNSCDLHYQTYSNNGDIDDGDSLKNLSMALKKSVTGFDNLIKTYSDQPEVSNDYKTCRNNVIKIYGDIDDFLIGPLLDSCDSQSDDLISVAVPDKPAFFNTGGVKFMLINKK